MPRVQARGGFGTGTTASLAFTSNVTAGSLLVVQVASAVAANTPTDTLGHTYAAMMAESVVNTNNRTRTFFVPNSSAGANTVQVTFGSSSAWILNILEYAGVKTTSPLLQATGGTGFGTDTNSGQVTTSVASLLLGFGVTENQAGSPMTPDAPWVEVLETDRGNNTPSSGYVQEQWDVAAGTLGPASVTLSSATNWAWQIGAFELAPPAGPTLEQYGYRVRNDDGSESAATWKAAQNTGATLAPGDPFRLRVGVNATGDPTSQAFTLQYRKVGDTAWRTVGPETVAAKVGFFDSPTSLQTQAVTGVGFAPKVVLLFGANHGVGGADQDDLHRFLGAMTATAQHAWGIEPVHGLTTASPAGAHSNAHCVYVPDVNGTRILDAVKSSLDADGFSIQWTDVWTSPIRLYYVALGGSELSVAVGSSQARTTVGSQGYTGVGFQPDAMIFHEGIGSSTMPITSNNFASSGFVGFATGAGAQYLSGWRSNNTNPQRTTTYQRTGLCVSYPAAPAGATPFREAALLSLDTDGFTLDWTIVNATAAYFFWIALKGVPMAVGTFTATPGAGNNQSVSLAFQPLLVFLQTANKAAASTAQAHFRNSMGVFDGTSKWSIWGGDRDNVSPTISVTRADTDRILVTGAENNTGPSLDEEMGIDTMTLDVSGFTVHYDITTVTGQEIQYFAIGV